ncbi:class I SAM-dependent methyltransferase [Streptomyces sp. NPDC050738]|uniref:class I SAM-dependent methyltransferase n=1 Tax=Streptomyces sp. NPDC050738 TaxID=3154744 RepID=UPI003447B572
MTLEPAARAAAQPKVRSDTGPDAQRDVDWAQEAESLVRSITRDVQWLAEAAALLAPGRQTIIDLGCGAGGMALALADAAPTAHIIAVDGEPVLLDHARQLAREHGGPALNIRYAQIRFEKGPHALQAAIGGVSPDLIWASAVLHHAPDQQRTADEAASLLAPGGRIALAEGGLPMRFLPWDTGLGEPGLESRLETAQHHRLAALRDNLPGTVRMPYGWQELLRRAGLINVQSVSFTIDRQAPPGSTTMNDVLTILANQTADLIELGLLDETDAKVWHHLLDPEDEAWLGHRQDIYQLTTRVVHFADRPHS